MLDYISDVTTVLQLYVTMLFNLYIVPGVSIGSLLLLGSLFFALVTNLWIRK